MVKFVKSVVVCQLHLCPNVYIIEQDIQRQQRNTLRIFQLFFTNTGQYPKIWTHLREMEKTDMNLCGTVATEPAILKMQSDLWVRLIGPILPHLCGRVATEPSIFKMQSILWCRLIGPILPLLRLKTHISFCMCFCIYAYSFLVWFHLK